MNAHNRYSYCLNSLLKFTDPSGYCFLMTESVGHREYEGFFLDNMLNDRMEWLHSGGGSCKYDFMGTNYINWVGGGTEAQGLTITNPATIAAILGDPVSLKTYFYLANEGYTSLDHFWFTECYDLNGETVVSATRMPVLKKYSVIPQNECYSGSNIFFETWLHYQVGGREDLYVSTSSLDFSFVSKKNLVYNLKDNTYSVNLFSLNKFSQTSLALGKVSLNSIGNNRYTINRDYYDFNIEWRECFSTRNIGTFGAGLIHGPVIDNIPVPLPIFPFFGPSVYTGSGPYWINFSGSVYIKP